MLYKIWFFGGASVIAVLSIQNIAVGTYAYVLLDPGASAGTLVLISAVIGIIMWYSIPHVFTQTEKDDDSYGEF